MLRLDPPATSLLAFGVAVLCWAASASALITVGRGNAPIADHNWPAGAVDVANLKTRLGWWEGPPFGGGEHQFLYRGDTATFQAALDAFGKIKAAKRELFVHAGPHEVVFLKDDKDPKADARVDWTFTVWNPQSWNHLYNDPTSQWNADDPHFRQPLAAPRLDVYLGGGGGVDWSQVRVPSNVTTADERASANGFRDGSAVIADVYHTDTSKPVAGAHIALTKNNGQNERHETVWETVAGGDANADGHAELRAVPAGVYRVVASAPGMAPRGLAYAQFGNDTFQRYAITLSPAQTIKGTVTDPDGKPVAGATVRADAITGPDGRGYAPPDRAEATTGADGAFALTDLPRGHCQLFASLAGHNALDVLKVYAVPTDDVVLRMTRAGTIKGKVARPDGTPPTGGYVVNVVPEGGDKVGSWGGSGNVKPDGTFQFDDVPPGKYTVSAKPNPGSANDAGDPRDVEVKPGEATDVQFRAK